MEMCKTVCFKESGMTTCKWPSDDDDEWNLQHGTPSSKKACLSPGALHMADVSDCFCVKAEISGRRTLSACFADLTVVKSVTSCWRMVRTGVTAGTLEMASALP